ncbi:HD domain-containing protein [Bradyrhizobium manausense]|uniref:HD domain-containing protein n=1 Tax=Bradyrhizobium TaxID=374 RepID=UPI001BAB2095|nr:MULTISPECIES: HD domain-containing protein [Bradyrhizobium]MBR0828075.1 HD domain-containing protein [Bradyrhizobium manausense]UVO32935.1 HD domain-containing protein [Bradyrhizobium arachidis]
MSTPVAIGGIVAPDSDLARKSAALAEHAHSKVLLNHVHRTWWFAEFIGKKREMKYDRELVYIASLLHDLGLSPSHAAGKRFEVDGADAASRFLAESEYPKAKADVVWDAIALHSLADIADRRQAEVALVHFGAHVDVMGLRIEEISPSLIDDTLALYPRIGMKAAFTEALAEVARKKPHTAIGTGLADIGRRLVHGLEIPNVCDIIHAAPFES